MATCEEVYAKFGITAEAAQLFETELATILLAREGEERRWHLKANPEEAAEFYEKLNRSGGLGRMSTDGSNQTLGQSPWDSATSRDENK